MGRFTGISLLTLKDRLGPAHSKRWGSGGAFSLWWQCDNQLGPGTDPGCYAHAIADYRVTPPNLDAWEQEMFDNVPFPKEGWALNACPKHHGLFADHAEEPD